MEKSNKKSQQQIFTPHEIEIWIGQILKWGVLLAAFLVLIGGVLFLVQKGHLIPAYGAFHGEPGRLKGVLSIVQTALIGRPRSIIQLGLLVLIATPVVRVIFSMFVFARQKDWLYVGVTLFVLSLLLFSLQAVK